MNAGAKKKTRGLLRFVARDPYRPFETSEEVDELLNEMDGVLDWTIHANGEVTVEYDPDRINDALVEDALSGVGLRLNHVFDKTGISQEELERSLGQ